MSFCIITSSTGEKQEIAFSCINSDTKALKLLISLCVFIFLNYFLVNIFFMSKHTFVCSIGPHVASKCCDLINHAITLKQQFQCEIIITDRFYIALFSDL